jgi:predicted dinucleotide-binding enzyme
MRIGILGSGGVATTLAAGLADLGHDLCLGTRNSGKLKDFQAQHPQVQVGSFQCCAAFGDLLILAVKGSAAQAALEAAGAEALHGKPVLDATNPIADVAPDGGVLTLFTTEGQSLMEQLQAAFPDTHFVKAFSCVGAAFMVKPSLPGGPPTMFICGDHDSAKQTARTLLDQLGWECEDMGDARAARAIEPLVKLWCLPGFLRGQWTHAFKLIKL